MLISSSSPPVQSNQTTVAPDLSIYDHIVVAFSGGKDSIAALLDLLERGAPKERIELWHHDVDGREGGHLMDWPVTRDYCRKLAAALDVPIYFSWKERGFEGEMLRDNQPTAQTWFETPDGLVSAGGKGRPKQRPDGSLDYGTRLRFPQVSADLSVRWCSAYLKIDVGAMALNNQPRFLGKNTLFVSGERAQESPHRARYAAFEPHRTDRRAGSRARRHVDHYRPVHAWSEQEVWAIIERWRVAPHPAYQLGWGRLSCAGCIFGSPNQWASFRIALPEQFEKIAAYEAGFGVTIHRSQDVTARACRGTAYEMDLATLRLAASEVYDQPIIVEDWKLPSGAFGESAGPL